MAVLEIPSHREYSEADRLELWTSFDVIDQEMKRNTMEFLADGWDYTKAAEEDVFVRDVRTGEWVHPATWIRKAPLHASYHAHHHPQRPRRRKTSKYNNSSTSSIASSSRVKRSGSTSAPRRCRGNRNLIIRHRIADALTMYGDGA